MKQKRMDLKETSSGEIKILKLWRWWKRERTD